MLLCKNCKSSFVPSYHTQTTFCSLKCAKQYRNRIDWQTWKQRWPEKYKNHQLNSKSTGKWKWVQVKTKHLAKFPNCYKCTATKSLIVHHIKPISFGGDEYHFSNLATLCTTCHRQVHRTLMNRVRELTQNINFKVLLNE